VLITVALAIAFVGFLMLFWFTPVGVPVLKRMGRGEPPPDLRFGYGPEETYLLLDSYGPNGVAHWRRLLLLDMIFPGIYATLFALLASAWADWAGAGPAWRTVAIGAPILAGASDYVENFLLLGILRALPRQIPGAVIKASRFTSAKFIFSYLTLAAPLLYWGATRMGWSG
jgi:hypothetical protein